RRVCRCATESSALSRLERLFARGIRVGGRWGDWGSALAFPLVDYSPPPLSFPRLLAFARRRLGRRRLRRRRLRLPPPPRHPLATWTPARRLGLPLDDLDSRSTTWTSGLT
ncbi:hypothetical protein BD626DRAFT_625834, partial [Schizophyllum amplum]